MRPNNPFYNQCKYLRYIYPKTSSISAYSVVAWCEKFMLNIYKVKSDIPLCCINNSPYAIKNCNGFELKEKTKQSRLFEWSDLK